MDAPQEARLASRHDLWLCWSQAKEEQTLQTLYRVLTLATWETAQESGIVPRCGNDHKEDGVHLNLPEAVDYTANRYFTSAENPVLLEIDTSSFAELIEWRIPLPHEPWHRPLARIAGIPIESVKSVKRIDPTKLNN